MQHRLEPGKLLYGDGNLADSGYAFSLVKEYDRDQIKAPKSRIKEWDYYYIGNNNHGLALTIADNSYMALLSVSVFDFNKKTHYTKSIIKWFSNGKLHLPFSSKDGSVAFRNSKIYIEFINKKGKRHLKCEVPDFKDKAPFRCDIFLEQTNPHSMVIATPFKKNRHFYYNQKINLLKANGYAKIGEEIIDFNKETYGTLDWGRGVWTYRNTWYWSSMNGSCNSHQIGFNLGYGFGDTSSATENMLFVDDKVYKLDDVVFDIPISKSGSDDFLSPWDFRSKNGDIALKFTPLFDRYSNTNALIIRSCQHQVFGIFNGYIIADNNKFEIKNIIGFAEKVYNRW